MSTTNKAIHGITRALGPWSWTKRSFLTIADKRVGAGEEKPLRRMNYFVRIGVVFSILCCKLTYANDIIVTYVKLEAENLKNNRSATLCANYQPLDDFRRPNFSKYILDTESSEGDFCRDESAENFRGRILVARFRSRWLFPLTLACVRNVQRQNGSAIILLVENL
uniref:Uncharacterized protein n=1 Tax=Romanomermis culicivorax TaxID=13658 RepID=A0A915KSB2_ROMCU